jgi:ubiquinone/menaquinone biosynthesis C-methylase UbiE
VTDSANPEYVLGHAAEELDRLITQAAFFGDLTGHTLRVAGLGPGMRVLDVGCGAGDVSFLAASIVGPGGSVVGVDQNPDAIGLAQGRATEARLDHVSFQAGDITQLPFAGEFDAVIGRLVLIYLGDPAAGVRAFARYLKPGGLVYFQEFCEPRIASVPPVPLVDECVRIINEAFARANITLYSGLHLARIYRDAGLPSPKMLAMSRVETGDDSPGYAYLAQTLKSLLPMIEKTGVATKEQVDIETLAARLKEESVARGAVLHMPELIAAWTRTAT